MDDRLVKVRPVAWAELRSASFRFAYFVLPLMVISALLVAACDTDAKGKSLNDYEQVVCSQKYILHALGGEDPYCYVNSIDILDKAYERGCRLFEADVSFTSDGVLVLAHSGRDDVWNENDWLQRLGQPYDPQSPKCTFREFRSFKIQGRYTANSFEDLIRYMNFHPDMYVMVDGGRRDYDDTVRLYEAIVSVAEPYGGVLDRLIASGFTTDMVDAALEVYPFALVNLYYDPDGVHEGASAHIDSFVAYCLDHGITSCSMSSDVYDDGVREALERKGLIGYVFSTNDARVAAEWHAPGTVVVGTDYLWADERQVRVPVRVSRIGSPFRD